VAVVARAARLPDVFALGLSRSTNRLFVADRQFADVRFVLRGDFLADLHQLQLIVTSDNQAVFERVYFNPECRMSLNDCAELMLKGYATFVANQPDCER